MKEGERASARGRSIVLSPSGLIGGSRAHMLVSTGARECKRVGYGAELGLAGLRGGGGREQAMVCWVESTQAGHGEEGRAGPVGGKQPERREREELI